MPQLRQSSISAIQPAQNGNTIHFFISNDIILQPQSCALIPLNHQFVGSPTNFCL